MQTLEAVMTYTYIIEGYETKLKIKSLPCVQRKILHKKRNVEENGAKQKSENIKTRQKQFYFDILYDSGFVK